MKSEETSSRGQEHGWDTSLDAAVETERIVAWMQQVVQQRFHRRKVVVGLSGGVDSSVVLALCQRAFGSEHVLGLILPERESSAESAALAQQVANLLAVPAITEEITPILESTGCYTRRDEAVRMVFPDYQSGWPMKVVLSGSLLEQGNLDVFTLVVSDPQHGELRKRVPPSVLAQIVAATNGKQRARMCLLYYHAEQRSACVVGTANKDEYELGFFVKYGDGGVDLNPIRHLYKMQVIQLARYLEVPQAVVERVPTTDTYPGGSTQEEFFFRLPYPLLDAVWSDNENGVPKTIIAKRQNLSEQQVQRVIDFITRKKQANSLLRTAPVSLIDEERA